MSLHSLFLLVFLWDLSYESNWHSYISELPCLICIFKYLFKKLFTEERLSMMFHGKVASDRLYGILCLLVFGFPASFSREVLTYYFSEYIFYLASLFAPSGTPITLTFSLHSWIFFYNFSIIFGCFVRFTHFFQLSVWTCLQEVSSSSSYIICSAPLIQFLRLSTEFLFAVIRLDLFQCCSILYKVFLKFLDLLHILLTAFSKL